MYILHLMKSPVLQMYKRQQIRIYYILNRNRHTNPIPKIPHINRPMKKRLRTAINPRRVYSIQIQKSIPLRHLQRPNRKRKQPDSDQPGGHDIQEPEDEEGDCDYVGEELVDGGMTFSTSFVPWTHFDCTVGFFDGYSVEEVFCNAEQGGAEQAAEFFGGGCDKVP